MPLSPTEGAIMESPLQHGDEDRELEKLVKVRGDLMKI